MRIILEFIGDGRNKKPDGSIVYWAKFGIFRREGAIEPSESADLTVSSKEKMHFKTDCKYRMDLDIDSGIHLLNKGRA